MSDVLKEIVESIDIIAEEKFKKSTQIYYGLVESVFDKKCVININGKSYTLPFYGGIVSQNKTYAIAVPQNNINQAFVIGELGPDGNIVPISNGGTGASTAAGARTNLDVVCKSGDTMTGNLFVAKAGDTYVEVQDTDTKCRLMMDSYTSGTHGLWSSGYYDGTNYHADGVWLIRRKPDNEVVVNGNCTGTAANVTGTVAVANGGTGATNATVALENLNGFNLSLGRNIPDNSDLNDYNTPGTYYCANGTSAATMSNVPSGVSAGFKLVVYYKGSNANINQELYSNGGEDFYIRYKQAATWYSWKRVIDTGFLPLSVANGGTGATDAASALAALGGCPIVKTDISGNSSATFTLSNSGRGVLVLIGAAVRGMYLVNATSSGGISTSSVLAATGATLNTSTNNQLTVSVTGFVTAAMLTINGTIGIA